MFVSITAEKIVELFEKDKESVKKFSELLIREPDVRLTIIGSLIRDVATKDYVDMKFNELKSYIDRRIDDLNKRIDDSSESLNKRIDDLYGVVKASLIAIVVTLASTIMTPLILRLLLG